MSIENIKKISIRGYLGKMGTKPYSENEYRAMYLSPFWQESNASFSVNYQANVWYDHGIGEGGSIIDLVARMENCSIAEAISRLEKNNLVIPEVIRRPAVDNHSLEIMSVTSLNHLALIGYLHSRSIDVNAAFKYCNEVQYRIDDREYFAIGFRNDAGGWELRNSKFKGSSAPKNITTFNNDNDTVMIFEGFFDFLSYLSLKENLSPTINTIVLNSVNNLPKALPLLQSFRTVHVFLDNDEAGRKTLDRIRDVLQNSDVVDQSAFYRNYKDLNDYIRNRAEPQPSAKIEHTAPEPLRKRRLKL